MASPTLLIVETIALSADSSTLEVVSVVAAGASAAVALLALGLSIFNFLIGNRREQDRDQFQRRMTEEAVETQKQLLIIEERRHDWEQQERRMQEEREREVEEGAISSSFSIRSGYRDSAHTWARVIATSEGPANARDVELDVWYEVDNERIEIQTLKGQDHRSAERLAPNESVHVAILFSLASPPTHTLRYRVDWTDGRGPQTREGQVPVL